MLPPLTPLPTPARWGLWDARKTLDSHVAARQARVRAMKCKNQPGLIQGAEPQSYTSTSSAAASNSARTSRSYLLSSAA